mgnify:CR=1 FL=1
MLFNNAKLKGRIVEIYGSQKAFAEAINKTETTVNTKLNDKRGMTQNDIIEWANALQIDVNDIGAYFFAAKVKTN